MKICVEKSTWSGWDSEEIPASANYEFEVDYGTEYVVDEVEADANHEAKIFAFKINKVRELYIEIKTSIKMIDISKENAEESEGDYYFELRKGQILILTTPTLDEGDTYKFALKEA